MAGRDHPGARRVGSLVRLATSLRIVIPLVLVTIAASIVATVIPRPDIFQSSWYLALLGLLSVQLLLITLIRVPAILNRKGRAALLGVVATHAGVLIVLAGMIYGGANAFRLQVNLVEGDSKVIPGLPFVLKLESVEQEYFPPGTFDHMEPGTEPMKRLDCTISVFVGGELQRTFVAGPGNPAKVEGVTLLPGSRDPLWYFELAVTGPNRFAKIIPFPPWSATPPTITAGSRTITAHRVTNVSDPSVELLELHEEGPRSLGKLRMGMTVALDESYSISLGAMKRSISILIYNRPQLPILILGCVVTFLGLCWHFVHRDRTGTWDRRKPLDHA